MIRSPSHTTVRFLIVNSFTGLNLLVGLLALFAASLGVMDLAAWCLLACVLLDACDGSLARHWKVTSAFGAQLDSLADMTSFCIASGVLAYYWFQPSTPFVLIAGASSLYMLSGAIRLARFNVSLPSKRYFMGMPTTFVSATLAITYLLFPRLNAAAGCVLVALLGLLMVSFFPYPKLAQARRAPWWVWAAIVCGVLINPPWSLWFIALGYIASGPYIWVRRYV